MLITLLTDFGTADHYVAAMKGVVLSRCPGATVVDITHDIAPQDVAGAAYALLSVYREFPAGTVHVAVVDPGVGSDRRPIVVAAAGQLFVGPDNGIFSYVLDREPQAQVTEITSERYFRRPVSATFHGRDVFAPTAAALAGVVPLGELGTPISDPVRLDPLAPRRMADGSLRGRIIHIDRFGNCITNISADDLDPHAASGLWVEVAGREITALHRFYADRAAAGELFLLWGSGGFLEIAANGDSAARRLGVSRGSPLTAHDS